jgi:glycosyltransferase involved in cell wall biosynthesis
MRLLMGVGHWRLIGGSERYAQETARQLVARGHRVTVLHGGGEGSPEPGLAFERFEPLGELTPDARDRRRLRKRLGELRPELIFQLSPCAAWVIEEQLRAAPLVRFVQDHTLFCPGLNKMLVGGKPCLEPMGMGCLTRHWFGESCHGLSGAHSRIDVLGPTRRLRAKQRELNLSARARMLLVGSDYMAKELIAVGLPPERIKVLPYCTQAGTQGPIAERDADLPRATREFLAAGNQPLLFTPARLTLPDKGLDLLLTALTRVKAPFRAIVAGCGPAAEWLQQKARKEGLGQRVHFTGWLEGRPLEYLYGRADLVPFPSTWDEPFGLVGIEAMAHGVPVVAFDVGGVGEWLAQGVGGWSVPRRDVDAMARAIDRALADPDLRREVGECGRRRVERDFRPEGYYDRLEALLRACVAGAASGSRLLTVS